MNEIIKQKLVIEIETNSNLIYCGICLIANEEIVLILNFDENKGEFDGFTIFKNQDFERYYIWDKEDYLELKNDNSIKLISNFDVNKFNDIESSLKSLQGELIAVYMYEDENSYFVGEISGVKDEVLKIKLIDVDSNWLDEREIRFDEISYIGFRTEYERELLK